MQTLLVATTAGVLVSDGVISSLLSSNQLGDLKTFRDNGHIYIHGNFWSGSDLK